MDSREFCCRTPRNDSGGNFSEMIRVEAQKSELQAKVGVADQKSELQSELQRCRPQNLGRITQKSHPNRVYVLLQKLPLKPFLNPPEAYSY